ncbi:Tol-Pal system subunit TolR [Candidatus Cyrtobacter comes]|uniref:Tol-Pal system subunit TolR n=1 Tax=Candidatus Cyrtobacter comes TaxID=675776 RepID=A0ABU5L8W9_9RICK|nr:biopolymer transporter ExbD [Candidatus Cyrtobacter comes]MDZ5762487.1 Tol-Pal system subunit TolR [Candidatus Cyrtobacter comes]
MFINRRKHGVISSINVTPFIDVLLVLLIIFMITAEEITTAEHVTLPDVNSSSVLEKSDCVVSIAVSESGVIRIENHAVSTEDFAVKISSIINKNKQCSALIYGDTKAEYGKITKLISLLKQNNVQTVSLVTQKEDR